MTTEIKAFREWNSEYELVGYLVFDLGETRFRYDEGYVASNESAPISESLPFPIFPNEDLFPGKQFRLAEYSQPTNFFKGLLPEEEIKKEYEHRFHSSSDSLITRLNNESVGALVFGDDPIKMRESRSYEILPEQKLRDFSKQSRSIAVELGSVSRLSLAGAQSKIGLHRTIDNQGITQWLLPKGSAPSTVIIKAGTFFNENTPNTVLNEALCMKVAEKCDFETAKVEVIDLADSEPILAIERFDREGVKNNFPTRLHQEDFCQALGLKPGNKYEPTDGNYINKICNLINRVSENPFDDRILFFQELLFDFLIGNCDNHLKNYSIIWASDWKRRKLSPLYDQTCTTIYPLDREMGISLCPSRKIDDVTPRDIDESAKQAGVSKKIAWTLFDDLTDSLEEVWDSALSEVIDQCSSEKVINDLEATSKIIWADVQKRLKLKRAT